MSEIVEFIDSHHHLWIPESRSPDLGYGWLRDIGAMKPFGDPTPIQRNYEWPEYANESRHRLLGSVYLQVDGAITDPVAESAWVQGVFDESDLSHAIVGLVDLSKSSAESILAQQIRFSSFRGVRQILSRLDDNPALSFAPCHYLQDDRWRSQFQLLDDARLSFDLQCYPEQMHDAADFFAQFPNVPVIIDHAGSPHDQSPAGLLRLKSGLQALAQLQHVSIKLCGFGMFDTQRSTGSIKPVVELILETFGCQRVMFGSNFPVDKLMGSFDSSIDMVAQCLQGCSSTEQDAIWRQNCKRIYRL